MASEVTLCFVDIDKCKVQLPEEMAAFPHVESFNAEIWAALDKHSVHIPNAETNRSWQVIIVCFIIHIKSSLNFVLF